MWRPEKNWVRDRNKYFEPNQPKAPYYKTRQLDYEAGADAMLKALRDTGYSPSDKFYNAEGKLLRYPKSKLVLIPDEEL